MSGSVGRTTLAELDHRHLWHPFTQMREWAEEEPLIIERGEGPYLFDTDGRRYIDATSSVWCAAHGHNHPLINKAVEDQLSKVGHSTLLGYSNVPSILLAEKLAAVLPGGLKRIFYADSGAAAVEIALKMAVQYWYARGEKRTAFLSLEGAYHGDTFGSMSVGYSGIFHRPFKSMLFKTSRFAPPYLLMREKQMSKEEAEKQSLEQAEKILAAGAREIAACIVEPLVQGAAGIWPHSSEYLRRLFLLTKSHGVLFIADEVAVGFGRAGTLFAVEQAKISPDLICLGKALTGGYLPVSAAAASEEIFEAFQGKFEDFKHFFHGHTFTGNPLGCAAALGSFEVLERENTLENLNPKTALFWRLLKDRIASCPHVKEVRGHGLFAGIEMGQSQYESYPVSFRAGKRAVLAARKRGIILRPLLDTLVLAPPLNIPENVLKDLIGGVLEAIREACV